MADFVTSDTRTLYAVLGVPVTASASHIKRAYRKMARATHSDLTGGTDDRFAAVAAAYETLADPERRTSYDQELMAAGRYFDGTLAVRQPTGGDESEPATARPGSRFTNHRSTPTRATSQPNGARQAAAAVPRMRPRRWWGTAWVAIVAGNLLRFTGLPADVLSFHDGERMVVGGNWTGVPDLNFTFDASTVFALLVWGTAAGVLAALFTVPWAARRAVRPVSWVETAAALGALTVVSSAWEVLLVRPQFWHVTGTALALWVVWSVLLWLLPAPAGNQQWNSWPAWLRQIGAALTNAPAWRLIAIAARWAYRAVRSLASLVRGAAHRQRAGALARHGSPGGHDDITLS